MAFEGVLLVRTHIGCVYVAVDASWHHFGGGCGFEGEWEVMYSIIFLVYADVGVVDGGGECWVGSRGCCFVTSNTRFVWKCCKFIDDVCSLVVKDHLPCEADGVSLDLVADFCSYRMLLFFDEEKNAADWDTVLVILCRQAAIGGVNLGSWSFYGSHKSGFVILMISPISIVLQRFFGVIYFTGVESLLPKKNVTQDNGVKLKNLFEKLNEITILVTYKESNEADGVFGDTSKATNFSLDSDSEYCLMEYTRSEPNPQTIRVCSKVFRSWDWTSNANLCNKGCRIILGWDMNVVNIMVLAQTSQAMHVKVLNIADNDSIFCSFIYADFNVALNTEDYFSGPSCMNAAMNDFKACVNKIDVMDINSTGLHYTWNQKPRSGGGVLKKLDRIIANLKFVDLFQSVGIFQPTGISDPLLQVTDYRPISCCNVLYKCISKIITNRIIDGLKEIVSENQSAFIPGRRISDNILITQELMHNYHRNRGPPRCAFKVDIQKAYDTVDWKFLDYILRCYGFHHKMVKWIMTCVTTASFSICINGDIHGFFKGKRGLRQGDPLSPYLFTLVMEVLTLIIKRRVRLSDSFRYHNRCEDLQLVNVCLVPSIPKSKIVKSLSRKLLTKLGIGRISPYPTRKSLQFCGRFYPLCMFIGAASFVIPYGPIIHDIEQLMRGFLWCNGDLKRGKAKVAWEDICLPKSEGGLGIRSLEIFNIALMTTHIWNIVTNKESLWVKWVHMYKLKGRTIWDIPVRADMSWGWRKLLQIREVVKPFFWKILGNGKSTSLWFDRWNVQSPLIQYITPREITHEGYNLKTCVADMVTNEGWKWPHAWLLKAPNINLIPVPNLVDDRLDETQWRDTNGVFSSFSVRNAWEALRPRGIEVSWWKVVWFSHNIPRHSFHMWLVMRNSLKTHDRIRQWDVGPNVDIISLRSAASYCIWMERNCRTFKNVRRTPEEVRDSIITIVRLKLLTCRFKNTTMVNELLARWKMPRNFRLYG
ncbi:putative RNA-directed DNA polymerase [Tanacetum coccineum]